MRIVIAGSRSLVAGALRRACRDEGIEVCLLGRSPDADIHFDAGKPFDASASLASIDALVICSASFAATTIDGMRQNLAVNVEGTLQLLNLSAAGRVPYLLYVSSVSAISAADSYGLTKAMAENILLQLCPSLNIKLAILRPSQLYDTAGVAAHHQPFLYFMIKRVAAQQDVTIYGSRDVERNYLHVDDFAQALIACLRLGTTGAFNAAHLKSTKVSEIAETARRMFGSSSHIAFDPDKPDLPEIFYPQTDSIFSAIPKLPQRKLEDGLREIAAFRELNSDAAGRP
jgi:nucleoside-diphosphate-sugar epimerase